MHIAQGLETGGGQTVLLPEGYRFDADEVFVTRVGDAVSLVVANWQQASRSGNLREVG